MSETTQTGPAKNVKSENRNRSWSIGGSFVSRLRLAVSRARCGSSIGLARVRRGVPVRWSVDGAVPGSRHHSRHLTSLLPPPVPVCQEHSHPTHTPGHHRSPSASNANVLRRMPPALAPGASPAHAQGSAARSLAIVGVELGGRDLRVVRPADLRSVQVLPSDAHHLRAFALEARRWEGGPTVAEGLADACSAQIGGGDQRTLLRRVTEAPLDGLLPALGCTCAEANSAGWSAREG